VILKFINFLGVVETHIRAKFTQAKCSDSYIILLTEKKSKKKQENSDDADK